MKKKLFGAIIAMIIILLIVDYVNSIKEKEAGPEFVFTYAENHPEDYPTTLGGIYFAQLVGERTEGRIQIIVHANGILGDEKTVIQQVNFGGIDFTRVSLSPLADDIPKLNVLQMPYLYRNSEHMWQVLDGEIGEDFMEAFQKTGLIPLSWYDAGARSFYNSVRSVTSVEDMAGLRIRVQESELMVDMVEALGATAVPLAYGAVYSGLETKVIDGAENNWPSYESTEHYAVAGYYTLDEHSRVPEVQLCSRSTWEKLSEEDRKIILSCARESADYERKLWVEREKKSEQEVKKAGVQVTELSPEEKENFRRAVEGVYQEYCTEYADTIEAIKNVK